MRVLQVINSLETGGAEKLLLETIPLYNKKGIEVDLLLLNGKKTPFLETLKGSNCCKIYALGTFVYNPFHVFRMIPFLRKYDIAHVHLFPSQYWIVMAKILSFSKIKIIVTEHSTTNPRIKNYLLSILDRFIYKFYDKIVCITTDVYQIIIKHLKETKSKFLIIQNGVQLQKIYDAQPYGKKMISGLFTDQDILIIQIASFNKHKDQQTAIKALKYLPDNVKLVFVGDGPLKVSCIDFANDLNLTDKVLFLGNRTDVPQLLKTADISILSTNGEGFSLVAIESMAAGIPFISSDVPGMINVKDAGILFEKENAEELAFFIKKLIDERDFYESIVNSGKRRAEQFDIDFMVNKHILLYKTILE
ncbi:glycosyltransferase [Flavobacterium saccharophilum]|uniref:Glycosyltransferase involved in cell wall bisynthesis n=1 Tax=Flavobacterium saccharophilum TaxID=29534 RepID=A0A1M7A0A5_9FLAO|nr:glycosyltransferase [Flavobacterium saccharophilum]SHL36147.1 Glycosyltransferase involved in cell wall bisynthesis [Flavobacterium saccharophilum]